MCLWRYLRVQMCDLLIVVHRYVPYVGIVTILMNDYPKFKVSWKYYSAALQIVLKVKTVPV